MKLTYEYNFVHYILALEGDVAVASLLTAVCPMHLLDLNNKNSNLRKPRVADTDPQSGSLWIQIQVDNLDLKFKKIENFKKILIFNIFSLMRRENPNLDLHWISTYSLMLLDPDMHSHEMLDPDPQEINESRSATLRRLVTDKNPKQTSRQKYINKCERCRYLHTWTTFPNFSKYSSST